MLSFEAKDVGDRFDCMVGVEVKNADQLGKIITSIKSLSDVIDAYRSEK